MKERPFVGRAAEVLDGVVHHPTRGALGDAVGFQLLQLVRRVDVILGAAFVVACKQPDGSPLHEEENLVVFGNLGRVERLAGLVVFPCVEIMTALNPRRVLRTRKGSAR